VFEDCSSLQSICIPASVETISVRCFDGCVQLGRVFLEPRSQLSSECRSALERDYAVTLK
jgi:hypothetical protein